MVKHNKTHKKIKRIKGGVNYDTLPEYKRIYDITPDEEPYYEGHYSKKKLKTNANATLAEIARVAEQKVARMQEIATNPNIEITTVEYHSLPDANRDAWEISRSEGPQWQPITYYKRKKETNSVAGKFKVLMERNILNFYLSSYELSQLSQETRKKFIPFNVSTGMQEYTTYYRLRLKIDDILENINEKITELERKEKNHLSKYEIEGHKVSTFDSRNMNWLEKHHKAKYDEIMKPLQNDRTLPNLYKLRTQQHEKKEKMYAYQRSLKPIMTIEL